MNARATTRTAIIGAGLMGRWHADAVGVCGGRVDIVVDVDRERAARLARATDARVAEAASDAVLRDADVVHVCTPPETHAALIRQALSSGCHVLVEKPLAPTERETAQLFAAARHAGRLLCPVYQFPFQRGVRRLISRQARLAPIRHVDYTVCTGGGDGRSDAARDRLVREILPHPLSLLAVLFQGRLRSSEWRVLHPAPGEARIAGTVDSTAVVLTLSCRGRPTQNRLRVIGDGGSGEADLFHGFFVEYRGARVSRVDKVLRPFVESVERLGSASLNLIGRAVRAERAYPGLRTLVARFHHAVRNGGPAPIGETDALDIAASADEIERALSATD